MVKSNAKETMWCQKCGKKHEVPQFDKEWKCKACSGDLDYAPKEDK